MHRRPGISMSAIAVVAVAASVVVGMTAANSVATSRAGDSTRAVTTDELKPAPDCSGIALSSLVVGINGTNGNDLLVGSTAVDNMDGNLGNDCILGGGGADSLRGSQGTDVCIGGPGIDTFHPTCETQIQ